MAIDLIGGVSAIPQIILKGTTEEQTAKLAPLLAEAVAQTIDVPQEWIVVEHNPVSFYRGGILDQSSAMALVLWKKRTLELQEQVAAQISKIVKEEGFKTVEVIYTNLDMNDFYEFK